MALVLENPAAASRMASNAMAEGRPDAAEALADLVEAVASGRNLTEE